MLTSVTNVQNDIDVDDCIACEYGEHVDPWFFTTYAEPTDLARVVSDEIASEVDLLEFTFGDPRTEKFAAFLRTIPADERDARHNYRELVEDYR